MAEIISQNLTGNVTGVVSQGKPGPFDGIVGFITSPLGIILIIGLIIILLIYLILKNSNKKKDFQVVSFARMINDDFKEKFSFVGLSVKGALVKGGFTYLGRINKMIHEKGKIDILYHDPKEDKFVKPKDKKLPLSRPYDIYMFRIDPEGFILVRFIRWLLGKQIFKYAIVDREHIQNFGGPDNKLWNIFDWVSFQRFGEVFISSLLIKDYLSDISIKYAHESELTHLGNYANKIIYLEMEHAKGVNMRRAKKEIETKAYKEYKNAREDSRDDDDD
jgi:hypothetical protein